MKKYTLLFLLLICFCSLALANNDAQKAREQNLQAITIFVDITALTRKNSAARKMTKLHNEYAKYGYELVDINTYTENGDLEGFFVSYKLKN